jgi:hypothetical protein
MIPDFSIKNSSVLEYHSDLVQLISEESEILEKSTSPDRIKRHSRVIQFLIELQSITSKDLLGKP